MASLDNHMGSLALANNDLYNQMVKLWNTLYSDVQDEKAVKKQREKTLEAVNAIRAELDAFSKAWDLEPIISAQGEQLL